MLTYLQVDNRLVNLANVLHIDLETEQDKSGVLHHSLVFVFQGVGTSLQAVPHTRRFKGADAEMIWDLLTVRNRPPGGHPRRIGLVKIGEDLT